MPGNGRGQGAWGAWLFVCALGALCAVLGILQYRAIAEVSIAARERLHSSLEASLVAFSQDFNATVSSAARALAPANPENADAAREAVSSLYIHGGANARYRRLFSRIALAVPQKRSLGLLALDQETAAWKPTDWPDDWTAMRSRFESAIARRGQEDGRGPDGRRGPPEPPTRNLSPVFEMPLFGAPPIPLPRRPGGPPTNRREVAWLIFEVDVPYVRDNILPEMLQRHLGADYQAEVLTRGSPGLILFRSDADLPDIIQTADASISLFDPQAEPMTRRQGPPGRRGGGPSAGPSAPGLATDQGRWTIYVRHRAGSLEAVVAQARWRSMAVTAGVLLMLAATIGALIRYTGRAQRLAELQMEFVAGVSHELRTPLTVIYTAAYNLRGNLAANPAQVERYGALIQRESGRLKDLVEQVLRFSGANAGHVIQERTPLEVEPLLDEAIGASKLVIETAGCVIEKRVEANLPLVLGDPLALRHALENLLANAAKYGAGPSRWIGLSAAMAEAAGRPLDPAAIEIRVADRGAGIPADEQKHIFDPFFRGARAIRDQVHGTGLGLSLVKKIVEAHGGSIRVRSEPMRGTEFIVRLPAVPAAESVPAATAPAAPPGVAG